MPAKGSCFGSSAGVRASYARRARHPVRPPVVHRRARLPQVRRGRPGRAGAGVRRGHRVRRLGDRGLRPRPRGRHAGQARPVDLPGAALARSESPATARMFCDILMPDGSPELRRPPLRAEAHAVARRRPRIHLLHPPRARVLPAQRAPGERRRAGAGRPRRLLRPHPAPLRAGLPAQRDHDAGVDGHLGGVQPPRGRPGPAGDRPALRRRADDGGQHHDLPPGDEGGRAGTGRVRLVHAQALHRPARLGHAHPHVIVRRRPQRLLRARRGVPAVQGRAARSSPASSATPPRSPP